MSTSRPELSMVTDESKFQEKTVNGMTIKFAQHEDDKQKYTVKTEEIGLVVRLKDGATLDGALEDCVQMIKQQQEQQAQEEMMLMQMLMQNPQLAKALFGFGAPAANGPASPGTSRFGLNFGGGAPMNFGSDNSEDFRPRSPGL